jgi:hypothetical protein
MNEVKIKTKQYIRSASSTQNNLQKKLSFLMIWCFGALVLAYVLFLGNTILNVVERKTLEISALDLSNEVGNLELEYLAMANQLDISLAQSMGFQETKNKHFATRKAIGSIKFINNEI